MPFRPWKIFVNLFKINTSVCTFVKIASITTNLITANELIWEGKPWHLKFLAFSARKWQQGNQRKRFLLQQQRQLFSHHKMPRKIKKNNDQSCFRLAERKFLCLYLELSGSILQNMRMKIIIVLIKSQVKYFYGRLFSLRKIVGKLKNLNL